jgi:dTDP-4-dehydrorhamnose reductase
MPNQTLHIIGNTGSLGSAFERHAVLRGSTVRCYSRSNKGGFIYLDLSQSASPEELQSTINATRGDIIVNFAAVSSPTAVLNNYKRAFSVNVRAPAALAELSRLTGSSFCHLSSVEVFDGTLAEFSEEDVCSPLNLYGYLKMLSEEYVLAADPASLVIRTSWNIPETNVGRCLVRETLSRLSDGNSLMAVDNVFTIASSIDTASNIYHLLMHQARGIIHLACSQSISRAALASYICKEASSYGIDLEFTPCLFSDLSISSVRGRNNVLSNKKSLSRGCTYSDSWHIVQRRLESILRTSSDD